MNDILQAKVRHLEKQLDQFSNIAQHQQSVLHEVFQIFDRTGPNGKPLPLTPSDVDRVKRRVQAAIESAGNSGGSGDTRWSLSRAAEVEERLASYVPTAAGGTTRPLGGRYSAESGSNIASRTLQTVRSLLAVWLEHMTKKVDRLLEEPQEKFHCFQDFPAEDTLTSFMEAYEASSTHLRQLIAAAHSECNVDSRAHSARPPVVTGNPFAFGATEEQRILQLLRQTVDDELSLHDDGDASSSADDEGPPQNRVRTVELGVTMAPARSTPNSEHLSTALPGPLRRDEPAVVDERKKPPPPLPRPLSSEMRPPSPSTRSVVSTTPSRAAAGSTSNIPPRRSNDSSQVWGTMGTDHTPRAFVSTPRGSGMGLLGIHTAGTAQPTDRLGALNATLQQLEFQLSGVAMHGRNSGSEAKFYALSKKLQKVRAEIVREQREVGELRTAERERETLRQAKEEHRRYFHR
jgi:hypothetical protein